MSLGEQIFMRIVVILFLSLVIFGFRVFVALIKKGWNALVNPGGKTQPKPQVQAKQPSKPPVTPVQPPKPPVTPGQPPKPPVTPVQPPVTPVQPPVSLVTPQPQSYQPPVQQKVQEYSGTIPLDLGGANFPQTPKSVNTGYYLLCVRGPLQGKRFEIGANGCTIGRNPGNSISFPPQTPGVSGNHCRLAAVNGQILLIDNNSTYGTYSGFGQKLNPGTPRPLQVGEAFFLGSPNGPGFTLNKLPGY